MTTLCLADYVPPRSATIIPFPAPCTTSDQALDLLMRRVRLKAKAAGAIGDEVATVESYARQMVAAGHGPDDVLDSVGAYVIALLVGTPRSAG